jgi:hypothetical protein
MATTLRCPKPDCRQKFPWDTSKGFPRFCACCGADIASSDDNVVSMPAFLTKHSKVPDKVARDYMDGSQKRVEMAAQMAGTSVEDMSELKVTNLTDRADTMQPHAPVSNPVTQFMAANPQAPVGFRTDGAQYSTQVQSGPFANSGAKMMTKLRGHHDAISHGTAVSDRPALETQQPGYRRRG